MQTGDGYVFHLDAPRERPGKEEVDVVGWLAAERPVANLRLEGADGRELRMVPRPDVEAAFPGCPHVTGFAGRAGGACLRDGALHFSFALGGTPIRAATPLPEAPVPLRGWPRIAAGLEALVARLRLRGSPAAAVRWNAGVRLRLAEARLRRGDALQREEGDAILECFAAAFPRAVVLQIGANDGVAGDPLARWFESTDWRGVLVEPIPHLADALARRYADRPGVVVERAAVSESDGEARLFRLAEEPGRTPAWFQQLASIDRSVLAKHRSLIPDIESRIIEEVVPCVSVRTLLERHGLRRIDLLVIDTEGHDYRILRQFDLSRIRPIALMFEHQHLPPDEKDAAYQSLRRHGYRWIETPEGDTLAWRRAKPDDKP